MDFGIYPERDAAHHLLSELIATKMEVNIISEDLNVCKVIASDIFGNKTISQVEKQSIKKDDLNNIIQKIKIISIKRGDKWLMDLDPEIEIKNDDFVVFLSDNLSTDFYLQKFEALL